ncbi:homoserine dehydrogenase [Clostridium rectalis]|uniref:homoserine dehydrogenase n=1 Tax=Clostridium rectalis TaxID=2040295 RepID=UPI000F639802|nr:homoserine dehydrogenase [Clostridium rectalis]
MIKKIILSGYGNVGKQFVKLFSEKKEYIKEKYNLDLILSGIIGNKVCIFEDEGINIDLLLGCKDSSDGLMEYGKINKESFYTYPIYEGDVLVECTYGDIESGDPALRHILSSINSGMDTVILSKGALVRNFNIIMNLAKKKKTKIKYSGATAAALPTMDIGYYCLAGCKVSSIVGILNGTTNYILTEMEKGNLNYEQALNIAQTKNITEKDNNMDTSGVDSACKILILANSFMGCSSSFENIKIKGINEVKKEDIINAKKTGKKIKLVSRAYYNNGEIQLEVKPELIDKENLLYGVDGSNKGIIFNTDTMGEICVIGGASNTRGAAAAALKDLINLYKI